MERSLAPGALMRATYETQPGGAPPARAAGVARALNHRSASAP